MINIDTLNQAMHEAERFLEMAKAYRKSLNTHPKVYYQETGRYGYHREHAAVKRISMDLTHKLADLRQDR